MRNVACRLLYAVCLSLAVPFAVHAQSQTSPATPSTFLSGDRAKPLGHGPTQKELDSPDPADWLYHTGNYAGTRYSALAQISAANVRRLGVACAYQLGVIEPFYAGPIVYHGVMYLTTASVTVALDAATCHQRWRYTWKPKGKGLWPFNRGVAIKNGYVVRGTPDGYLLALDAADGKRLYRFYTGGGMFGGIATYAVNGKQYVAVTSGGGSPNFGGSGSPTLFVFSLPAAR